MIRSGLGSMSCRAKAESNDMQHAEALFRCDAHKLLLLVSLLAI